ncbi:MAG: exosortase H-associated membrane protein [Usitatibacter sp.]
MALPRAAGLAFFARALLWMPLALALWYAASPALSWIGATVARPGIAMAAGKVAGLKVSREAVTYSVEVAEPYVQGRASRQALAEVEVRATTYTFGIALFLALAMASRETRRIATIASGTLMLAIVPAWGIAFDALRQLGVNGELAPWLAWPSWARETIALGYQVGSLLLPTLVPVAAWLAFAKSLWMAPPPGGPA